MVTRASLVCLSGWVLGVLYRRDILAFFLFYLTAGPGNFSQRYTLGKMFLCKRAGVCAEASPPNTSSGLSVDHNQ